MNIYCEFLMGNSFTCSLLTINTLFVTKAGVGVGWHGISITDLLEIAASQLYMVAF